MMNNRRKAAIGYATYVIGTRVAKGVLRHQARTMVLAAREQPKRRLRKRRMIPLVGGAAAAIAGAAVFASRHRGATPDA
jgi:3-polyprenyl-4-hydroxybenzoate decarboxylase